MKRLFTACFIVVAFCGTSRASAGAPGSGHEYARTLMREGNAAYAAGDVKLARSKYLMAWDLAQGFDIACNLGRASADLGETEDAARFLGYCLDHYSLSSREDVVQAETEIRATFARVQSEVGALVVRSAAGADISVDGVSVGQAPLVAPVYVKPGVHRIESSLAGHRTSAHSSTVGAGESQTVEFLLIAAEQPPARRVRAPTGAPSPSYVAPMTTAALAVAGVAVGTGFLVASLAKRSSRDDHLSALPGSDPCGAGTPYVAECVRIHNLSDDARTLGATALVALGVGAVGAVATYFLWPSQRERRERSTHLIPLVSDSVAGLGAQGRF